MKKILLFISFYALMNPSSFAQVEDIQVQLHYNQDNCNYSFYILIEEGTTGGNSFFRIQGNSGFAIETPSTINVVIDSLYNPIQGDPLTGSTNPQSWYVGGIYDDSPYDRKTEILGVNTSPTSRYGELGPDSLVHLFDFKLSADVFGGNGLFVKDDYSGFTIGSLNQLYDDHIIVGFPTEYAEVTGLDSIAIGATTTLSPTTGGVWSTNTDTIATVDNNGLVTGTGDGFAQLTYTPDSGGCPTTAIVKIGDTYPDDDPVNPVDPPPSPAGDPSVAAYIDGNGAQGIIIPRLSEVERLAIEDPALGLLLFQYDSNSGFYYFDQGVWKKL